jgi:hypothetical protein
MKQISILFVFLTINCYGSVIGVSTHPFQRNARVLSAEMTGYMSQRHEMGMGLRYTHELRNRNLADLTVAGGQESRNLTAGGGIDIKLLSEQMYRPRFSFKPYFQYQKFDDQTSSVVGMAPALRKGFSVSGAEFFPYLALPSGLRVNTETNEFVYYSALSLGASMPIPGNSKLIISMEGNRDFGASSDYLGALVSWVWN